MSPNPALTLPQMHPLFFCSSPSRSVRLTLRYLGIRLVLCAQFGAHLQWSLRATGILGAVLEPLHRVVRLFQSHSEPGVDSSTVVASFAPRLRPNLPPGILDIFSHTICFNLSFSMLVLFLSCGVLFSICSVPYVERRWSLKVSCRRWLLKQWTGVPHNE
ncbi:hypothetical protein B0T22DRAFT_467852 [Podospora appendiculata]|uniref:Uncharacterized protein n=1 Tax=Podospora appendiculata TaxID=314037 RepID=A0AAE1C8U6_9PEZI|nr:hypothetical protein B0T22DRAFT_467852 [Podospora appendiculata]